ncbi:MAG TPA: K(+)-transporting ATPase subunit F [Myxococcota bacterium]|nr:K(+)-transporting ATPase subunit F [Myxococcota bacterium]
MRSDLRSREMIALTAAITVLLFVYLFTALVRPEWF